MSANGSTGGHQNVGQSASKTTLQQHSYKDSSGNEIMKRFSNNLRRMIENRENLVGKAVTFSTETVETSFGGTHSAGRIMDSSVLSDNGQQVFNRGGSSAKPPLSETKPFVSKNAKQYGRDQSPRRVSESLIHNKPRTPVSAKSETVNDTSGDTAPLRRHTMERLCGRVMTTPECFKPVTLETPKAKPQRCSSDLLGDEGHNSSMTVAVRVRPLNKREQTDESRCIISMVDNETMVAHPDRSVDEHHRFTYDYSFWSYDRAGGEFASQEYVYNTLAQPILAKAFEGYNTCLFAYGQTGSGKSYSMMGHSVETGIIPRFCEELVDRTETCPENITDINVEISFFEIYNEKIHDLLCPTAKDKMGKKPNLRVREHPVVGPYVEGLSSYVIESFEDIKGWLSVGNKHRATAATGMNDKSSRSHSVFTLVMTQTKTEVLEGKHHEHSVTSKINLVDLAGSERQSLAKTSGDRLREGASINKSLHTLGKVISMLSDQSIIASGRRKKHFIPYRDSVLTWLLKESLGGNSKTAMLATISPTLQHFEETLSTLRYAKQARSIINIARVNEDPKARLIRELRAEIEKLRVQTGIVSEDVISSSLVEISSLKQKLSEKEREMAEITRSWQERLKQSEQHKLEESLLLERSGIALKIDNRQPNLVNLNEDPQLSEMLLYVIHKGKTHVGRMKRDSTAEIQLNGPLIADAHCIIDNVDNVISLSPQADAPTYVNGELITGTTVLHHGDRVILGGDHYFRLNHPLEVQKGRKTSSQSLGSQTQPKDFEFARQELIAAQNARLEAELEEARRRHEEEMRVELERQETEAQQRMDAELEKKKLEADEQLNQQRHLYEDRLAELNKLLKVRDQKEHESDQYRQEAEHLVQKLEQQKQMLEKEVLANRKRLDREAKASLKSVEVSRFTHAKIFEQLEQQKQKIQRDVERLEQMRSRRGTPCSTPISTPRGVGESGGSKTDLYRVALLLREANKITQFLQKDTMFTREDVIGEDSGPTQTLVKVTNTKLGVSTFWTLDKFEDRLVRMRELYQGEAEGCPGLDEDDLFYDSNDAWEKDDRIGSSPMISPRLINSLGRTEVSNLTVRLSFSPAPSKASPALRKSNPTDTADSFRTSSENDSTSVVNGSTAAPPVVFDLCRTLISTALDQYKDAGGQPESSADRLLQCCQAVKVTVKDILEAYNHVADGDSTNRGAFQTRADVQSKSVQLVCCLNLLLSHNALWTAAFTRVTSTLITDLCGRMASTVRKLGHHMALLLQGCENDIDSMVQTSASQILESVYELCRHCSELAIATETPMSSLRDSASTDKTALHTDIQQQFQSGSDTFVDKTLHGALKTAEECITKAVTLSDDFLSASTGGAIGDILSHVDQTTASARVLLQKLQDIQVQLDSTLLDSGVAETRSPDFYHHNYLRCQSLVTDVGNLVDGISLLVQVSEPIGKGDTSGLRRLLRCVEMIQKSSTRILAVSSASPENDTSVDIALTDTSTMSDSQIEQIDFAIQEVKLATAGLTTFIKKQLEKEGLLTPGKSKRVLPMSPRRGNNGLKSPTLTQNGSGVSRNLCLVDLAEY